MSWTIEDSKKVKEQEILKELDDTLREAADRNILMFCAARDQGLEQRQNPTWPAKSKVRSCIFRIGAAIPSGASWPWVEMNAVDFLFPGAELRETRPELVPPNMASVDGSSTATALASGLAALLLWILLEGNDKDLKTIRKHEKLKNILGRVRGDNQYVQIWELFDDSINSQTEGEVSTLKKMAKRLFSWSEETSK